MTLRILTVALIASLVPAWAENLHDVLARMNREADSFRQITAQLKKTEFTAVLDDRSVESGKLWLARTGHKIAMRVDITQPQPKAVGVEGDAAQVYYPKMGKTGTVQIYDLGKAGALVDQFLVLGFGSSGKELLKNYAVTLGGEETVGGQKTSRLVLVPKSAKVLEQIQKVELWIPLDAGHPVQQKIYEPGGNYYLFTYSDLKLNPGLPESAFRLNLPEGVHKEFPQKDE
jgi:outer membrane lipoprotein-sorting protein